jgi:hypothetical protein
MKSDWLPWNQSAKNITEETMYLNKDFREFIESLNDNQVRYLLVGGYAVAKAITPYKECRKNG